MGKILLAENGPENQRLITFFLKSAGAEVEIATNGKIALAMIGRAVAENAPYDLLLTDLQMPELDGYSLARTLRELRFTLPIIALSAHAMAEIAQKCLDAGCNDLCTKPINRNVLIETCHKWIAFGRNS
jgi:CheY-like chemotaxis protein